MLADIILILHFLVVIFITVGFLLVPIGYHYDWNWIKNFKLRLFHFGLILLVTGSILSAKLNMLDVHQYFGVALLGLVFFRILCL